MKRKYTIDRKKLNAEEISKGKNFDQLMNMATPIKLPFYKAGWFGPSVITAVLISASIVTYILMSDMNNTTNSATYIPEKPKKENTIKNKLVTYSEDTPCINPPSESLQINGTSYKVDNQKGDKIKHASGTIIEIPKNAFEINGKLVEGEVEIKYKEYKDQVDILLSGIPMHYDSANTDYVLESAGMVQINGFQDDIPVDIANGKTIKISFPTEDNSKRFNLYELDTANNRWDYMGKPSLTNETETVNEKESEITQPKIEESIINEILTIDLNNDTLNITTNKNILNNYSTNIDQIQTDLNEVKKEIKELENNVPIQPKKSINKDRQFNLEVDPEEFPELSEYEKVIFEVIENTEFNNSLYSIEWDDVILEEYKKGEMYRMKLSKDDNITNLMVRPVFEGENMEEAIKKFENYTKKLELKKEEEKVLKEKYEKAYQKYKEELEKIQQEQKVREEAAKNWKKNTDFANNLKMSFEIERFGTWNCDSPVPQPKGKTVSASFSNLAGTSLILGTVYLIERKRNAIFPYNYNQYNKLKFNPEEDNILVGFTSDDQIAIFQTDKFSEIKEKKHEFKMELKNALDLSIKNLKKMILNQ
jgi:hypothetical protein